MNARRTMVALAKRLVDRSARWSLPLSCCSILAVVMCWCGMALGDRPPYEPEWTQWVATPVDDTGNAVAVDKQGHVYFAGMTDARLAGSNAGLGDVFLVKYNADGGLIWIRQFGTASNDWVAGVEVDHKGHVLVAGHNGVHPVSSPYLAKFDDQGNLLWVQQYATNVGARCWSLALDGAGNAFICGDTAGELGGPNAGGLDAWVTKIDDDGRVLWNAQIGSSDWDNALAVGIDHQNQVYITGFTFGDLAGSSAGERDIYIAKFDADGRLLWARQIGTDAVDVPDCLAVNPTGDPVIGGLTEGDLGGPNHGVSDAFLAKFDGAGNMLWISQVGTQGSERFRSVAIDTSGGILAVGDTSGAFGGLPAGMGDALLVKFDPKGSMVWARQFGTADWEYPSDVALDHLGDAYLAVSVSYEEDRSPMDAFLAKFVSAQPCADITGDDIVAVNDLLAVIGAWGSCPPRPLVCNADIDGDGSVNVGDLLAVIGGWGACP